VVVRDDADERSQGREIGIRDAVIYGKMVR